MKSVNVIGLGYVGLPSAALIANAGYKVHGVDINSDIIAELNAGVCRLDEDEVKTTVKQALQSGQLEVSCKPKSADIFILCVPTPVKNRRPDLSMVIAGIKSIVPFLRVGNLVILESTSPIGTTEVIIGGALQEAGLDPYSDIDVCYCPERVFPGDTVREILGNDRVVGGLTEKAAHRARDFYLSFCEGHPNITTAPAAEFSKLMENTFRDVNIALANVFSHIAESANVDVMDVIKMANKHPRVNVHIPGPGVGGHCIPVDPWFLIDGYPDCTQFLRDAREINDGQSAHFLSRAETAGLKPGSKVAILGAAYRGDIDDARDTPTQKLIKVLGDSGYIYETHDPHVTRMNSVCGYPAKLTSDLDSVLNDADAVFVMTDHSYYKALNARDFSKMKGDLIIDTRRLLNALVFKQDGYRIIQVGMPTDEAICS